MSTIDINAWISAAKPPQRLAVIYGRGDLIAEHDRLELQLVPAMREQSVAGHENAGVDVARQVRALREQIEASALPVTFRALSRDEIQDIEDATTGEKGETDSEARALQYVATSAVDPALTLEQALALKAAVGEGQFLLLFDAAYRVSNDRVTVPTSLAAEAVLASA